MGIPKIEVIELMGKLVPLVGICEIRSLSNNTLAPNRIQVGIKRRWSLDFNNSLLK